MALSHSLIDSLILLHADARRLARAALQRALQDLNAEARDQTKAALAALRNVVYVGFSLADAVDKRVQTHVNVFRRAGARVDSYISRRRKDGGKLEQELIEHFKANVAQTYQTSGLVNIRSSKDRGKPGFVYVLVRVA